MAKTLPFNQIDSSVIRRISVEAELLGRDRALDVIPSNIGSVAHDGSLRPTRAAQHPYEMRLGPFAMGTAQDGIETGYRIAKAWCGTVRVNYSCGFHVHVDMTRAEPSMRRRAAKRWLLYEPLFWSMVPNARLSNRFTMPLHNKPGAAFHADTMDFLPNAALSWEADAESRYWALNVSAYARHRTYEVRMASGMSSVNRATEWAYIIGQSMSSFTKPDDMAENSLLREAITHRTHASDHMDKLWEMFRMRHCDPMLDQLMREFQARYNRTVRAYPIGFYESMPGRSWSTTTEDIPLVLYRRGDRRPSHIYSARGYRFV
jgi:hypothetical protein